MEQSDDDVPYEEDLLKAPYAIGLWLRYLEHKGSAPPAERFILYERAVRRTTAKRGCVVPSELRPLT